MRNARQAVSRTVAALVALAVLASPALALHGKLIPSFARKYNVSCQVCHAPVPKLNATGEAFAGNGFEFLVGEEPRDTVATGDALLRLQRTLPLAIRFDAYSTVFTKRRNDQANVDLQTPWVIKLLSGGQVSDKISYYTYFLLTERGGVEGLEDAYLQFTDIKGSGVSLIVGQFQVSDPLFKRELRLSYDDYQAYRLRVGNARADLAYDRGLMALWSPWDGGDLSVSLVNGRGLNEANDQLQYDDDNGKNVVGRYSHELGGLRVGAFGYFGREKQNGATNEIRIWGPDLTLSVGGNTEINAQLLQRTDSDPFYSTCSFESPCPGGKRTSFRSSVRTGFVEAIVSPQGPSGRLFFDLLYNWVDADAPVASLRLGEQADAPGYVSSYRTVSAGVHWLHKRNVRMMAEGMWDVDLQRARIVTGLVVGF